MRQFMMTVTALAALGGMVVTAQAENQSRPSQQALSAANLVPSWRSSMLQ
jgi:hypothetical protein